MFDQKTKDIAYLEALAADYPQMRMNWHVKSIKGLVLKAGWNVRPQIAKILLVDTTSIQHTTGERIKGRLMSQGRKAGLNNLKGPF